MYCQNCGTPLPEEAKFCPSCGSRTAAANEPHRPEAEPIYEKAVENPATYKAPIPFRSIAVSIILSIVTCGIYSFVWLVKLVDNLNTAVDDQNDTNGIAVFLLGLVTCGIYTLYWLYKAGQKVGEVRRRRGLVPENEGIIYLILSLFGFHIIAYAMIQNELNQVAAFV